MIPDFRLKSEEDTPVPPDEPEQEPRAPVKEPGDGAESEPSAPVREPGPTPLRHL